MKLKNYEIEPFLQFLFDLKLKGKESRMRTRLHKMVSGYYENVFLPERDEIVHQYGMKDDTGNLVVDEEKKGIKIIPEFITEFNKEYNELLNEEYIIEENEINQSVLTSVGDSLLSCDIELSGELALLFDGWCEKFEEAIERYTHKEE